MKHTTDRMLTRIKDIYLYIRDHEIVSTQDLVEAFGSTPRTIQRDLNVLVCNDLIESPTRGKWIVTNKKVNMTAS